MSSSLGRANRQIQRRARQLRSLTATEGVGGITKRLRRAAARWLEPEGIAPLPVRAADVKAADLSAPFQPKVLPWTMGQPLSIHWVMTPPAESSGGHTTIFRILKHLQAAGHRNQIYFYDVYGADLRYHEGLVRSVYGFDGPVDEIGNLGDAHALIATSWPTAYGVFNARSAGRRFYFVQDFEPFFFPVGGLSALAEATYRMGFYGITAGQWLTLKLRSDFGMGADWFDFGCDTARYKRDPASERRGIAFYARHEAPRRAFELGIMALELFHERCPDVELHFYGQEMRGRVPLPIVDHGEVSPDRLNEIYNRCFAALSLSMTNVSLVPHEMLAAGCIPVVNDAEHNRMVLDNPYVRYAPATPRALADALAEVVTLKDFDGASAAAAASVASRSWADAGRAVDRVLRREVEQQLVRP